ILPEGIRKSGPLYAFNVFSRVENKQLCAAARRKAPCVLTNIDAQERALDFILHKVLNGGGVVQSSSSQGRPPIGAILIIAGGPLTDRPCDDSKTAQDIKQLRQAGIYTFVPAGNDGKRSQVRFPGCASDAVTVGALDRGGNISSQSNGSATRMVALYTDGDTLVLPIRTSPIPGLACMQPSYFRDIVMAYEKVLAVLGYYKGEPSGELDAKASDAVLQFQNATTVLAPNGKFDAATLLALAAKAEKLDDNPLLLQGSSTDVNTIATNMKWANLGDLSAYKKYFCGPDNQGGFYETQYVAGTLVSAAVAAGQFLSLLDRYKDMSTNEIFKSVMQVAAGNHTREFDLTATEDY